MESYLYLRFCFIKVCLFKKKKKREGKKSTFCSVKERNEVQKYSIFSPLFTCDYICDTCTDSPCRLHSYPLNISSSRSAAVWWGDLVLYLVSLLQEKSLSYYQTRA